MKKILIAEDNHLNAQLFCDLLGFYGYDFVVAYEGSVVMDLTREHVSDLILMDVKLPNIPGIEVTKLLKKDKKLKNIPIIGITADAMNDTKEEMINAGCIECILKPISVSNFLSIINT